jgi:hypothetical protein
MREDEVKVVVGIVVVDAISHRRPEYPCSQIQTVDSSPEPDVPVPLSD